MGGKRTLAEHFAALAAKNEAEWHEPASVARREAEWAERRAKIDAEIAAGLRDEDGTPITPEEPEDGDEDEDEYDPDAPPEEF